MRGFVRLKLVCVMPQLSGERVKSNASEASVQRPLDCSNARYAAPLEGGGSATFLRIESVR